MYYYKLKKIVTRSFDNSFIYLLFTYYLLTYSNLSLSRHELLWITSEFLSKYLHHLGRYILG